MEFEILGFPPAGPTLDLDHEQFAYAGKFVMSSTGKSVARDGGSLVGAVAFNEDRSSENVVRLRYVTVRRDRQGDGIGSRLLRFTAEKLREEYDRVLIAANNPIAYRSCYAAGFVYTGQETGLAELLLAYAPSSEQRGTLYAQGLDVFRDRDMPDEQQSVLERTEPPSVIESPPE